MKTATTLGVTRRHIASSVRISGKRHPQYEKDWEEMATDQSIHLQGTMRKTALLVSLRVRTAGNMSRLPEGRTRQTPGIIIRGRRELISMEILNKTQTAQVIQERRGLSTKPTPITTALRRLEIDQSFIITRKEWYEKHATRTPALVLFTIAKRIGIKISCIQIDKRTGWLITRIQ